jgi:hypothetical protein
MLTGGYLGLGGKLDLFLEGLGVLGVMEMSHCCLEYLVEYPNMDDLITILVK